MSSLALTFLAVSQMLSLPPGLLSSICLVETHHTTGAINPHDGSSPSYGVCQVKLATAQYVGYKGSEKGLIDPKTNITIAGKYLRYQLFRYNHNPAQAVSAYNAGHASHKNKTYVNKVFTVWGGSNNAY